MSGARPTLRCVRWVQVTWGQAQFALGIEDGTITEAPPLAKWAIGVTEAQVAAWFRQRGASFAVLDEPHPPRVAAEPGVYWWCEYCHGTHTMDGIRACRRTAGSAHG